MSADRNVDAVCTMLQERSERGLQKYGVTTERTDTDLLGWVQHALEEACDLAIYLMRIKQEINGANSYRSQTDCGKQSAPPESDSDAC